MRRARSANHGRACASASATVTTVQIAFRGSRCSQLYPLDQLYPLYLGAAEKSSGAHKQHNNERNIGGKKPAPATQMRIQVPSRQALKHTNEDGCDDGAGNAIEAANYDNREDLEPNQRQSEATTHDEGP